MQYNRGYILGRLLVRLGQLEGLEESMEQVYQKASTFPPQVFPSAFATLISRGKEESIRDFMKLLPVNAFESGLNRREQGAFALGYSHELAGYVTPLEEEPESSEIEASLTDRYEFRIDPNLKEWIKSNGGGEFVRTVLKAEQVKQRQEPVTAS